MAQGTVPPVIIGQLRGVPVRVHWGFVVLAAVLAAAGHGLQVLVAFLAVFGHEWSHVAVARAFGVDVEMVELLPWGGRARLVGLEAREPAVEGLVAAAGPVASLVAAAAANMLVRMLPGPNPLAAWFETVNVGLAGLNLLPAAPLDGGRLLRAVRAPSVGYRQAEAEVRRCTVGLGSGAAVVFLVLAAFGAIVWQVAVLAALLLWAARAPRLGAYWAVRDLALRRAWSGGRRVVLLDDFAVREDARVGDVLNAMRPRRLHRVNVLTADEQFLGTLWERDLLGALVAEGPEVTAGALVRRQN